jgi:2-polyprenyl-6-methoxyphenol hydroxylase-like FAD-dependent oxidoreductase
MEVLERLGCAENLLRAGAKFRALHIHTRPGRAKTRVDLLDLRWGDTRYPFWLSIPQYEVEHILEQRLEASGLRTEWSTELISLQQSDHEVLATLKTASGASVQHRARWALGCDGGRSRTRELLGVPLYRTDLGVSFALADVHTESELAGDEGHMVWADEGLLLIVPMPVPGLWRLIAQVDEGFPDLDAGRWNDLVIRRSGMNLKVQSIGWHSRFRLTSGVSERLRRGRVFLLGDAAHVHSPVGGQGLNTGVQDAHNLLWKLGMVARDEVDQAHGERLLDSYESERHPIAVAMVRSTARATRLLTGKNRVFKALLRGVAPQLLQVSSLADRLGRGVGMLDLRTEGRDRLPNPELASGGRLHDRLDPIRPTRLAFEGRSYLVRPDAIVAREGEVPVHADLRIEDRRKGS